MFGQAKADDVKTRVFEVVGKRISKETERLLRKTDRWNEQDGLVLNVEIKKVRLRKNLAVLMLWQVIKGDEVNVRIWATRGETVVATENLKAVSDVGGIYATMSARRRLEILSDLIARKMVKRL